MTNSIGRLRFYILAFILGVCWYAALLIPPGTRGFLVFKDWHNFQLSQPELLVIMCLTSVTVAILFRRLVVKAKHWWARLLLAVFVPLCGTILFTWGVIIFALLTGKPVAPEGARTIELVMFMGIYAFYGLLFAVYAGYVVVPMGYLSQFVMQRYGDANAGARRGEAT